MPVLLSTAYCPPVEYFAVMAQEFTLSLDRVIPSVVYIEACEHYQKQSYRNRCRIYSGAGAESLSFPISHEEGAGKVSIREIKVDYSKDWVVRHRRAISSAYGTSAFFEYYKDEFFGILESGHARLFDLNLELLRFFIDKTGLSVDIRFTDTFDQPVRTEEGIYPRTGKYGTDYRELIHPKRRNRILEEYGIGKPYFQVFSGKYGFIPNLSIMDLLFNEGPDAITWLKRL